MGLRCCVTIVYCGCAISAMEEHARMGFLNTPLLVSASSSGVAWLTSTSVNEVSESLLKKSVISSRKLSSWSSCAPNMGKVGDLGTREALYTLTSIILTLSTSSYDSALPWSSLTASLVRPMIS